jgi:hypothetical protein
MLAEMKTALAVGLTALVLGPAAVAENQYAQKRSLEQRVARLEAGLRESRYQQRVLYASVTSALVSSGQAKILAGRLEAELSCIKQVPLVDADGLRPAPPGAIVDYRMAAIENRCRAWEQAR